MSDLVDTTEMYLKSIMELLEEGVVPLRARIAERLGQSGPTVSQTVARMERDGLLTVLPDRRLELTQEGRTLAQRVLRKHRLVERLLTDVVGLDWRLVHDEACRWEHVVSEDVEKRLVLLLEGERVDPYGNPIPALEELGLHTPEVPDGTCTLTEVVARLRESSGERTGTREVEVVRLGEMLQADAGLLGDLDAAGVRPGQRLRVEPVGEAGPVRVRRSPEAGGEAGGEAEAPSAVLHTDEQRHVHVVEL